MQLGIMTTDNGTHSPEKWASAVAINIINVAQTLEGEKLLAAQKLQLAITEALINHHEDHQKDIIADLNTGTHFDKEILHHPGDRAAQAISDIQAAAKGTPWENHFLDEAVIPKLYFFIGQSLVDLAHVERLYWGDNNPDHEGAKAYKADPTGNLVISASDIIGEAE